MKKLTLIICCVLMTAILSAQTAHKHLRSGDKSYEQQNYSKAEENYRKAVSKDNSPKSNYNLGNAVYQQEKYKEAVKHYQTTAQNAKESSVKSKAFYNMGNAHLNAYQKAEGEEAKDKQQHLKDAIDAYKHALRNNPKDMDAKHNLTMAMQEMKQQQQQNQQNKDQNKKNQNQQNEDNKNKEQQNKDKGQQDQQQQNQPQNQDQNQPQQQDGKTEEQEINKQEAEKLLQIMNDEERKVQEKLNKSKSKKSKSNKDW